MALPKSGPIEDLNLTVRSYNCLKRNGLLTIEQVLAASDEELLQLRNLGRKGLDEIREKIEELGGPPWEPYLGDDDGLFGSRVPRRPSPGSLSASAEAVPETEALTP